MALEAWLLAPISAAISVLFGLYFYNYVNKQDSGTDKMKEISDAIKLGASAFIRREYTTLAIFASVVAVLMGIFLPQPIWKSSNLWLNLQIPVAYLFGSFCSALAGYLGLNIATKANAKVANAAQEGLNKAVPIGLRGGAVMGLAVVGIGMLGVSVVYYITGMAETLPGILAYSFGASSLSLFAKAGGGIFTKTADISADLVGKVELGIPEDDPRNPAVIADNVGDNVGDVAGMGADWAASFLAMAFVASSYLNYPLQLWGAAVVGLTAGIVIGTTSDYFTSENKKPVMKTAEAAKTGAATTIITGFSYGLQSVVT